MTYFVWVNTILPKFEDYPHALANDKQIARDIMKGLWNLVEQTAGVLGIDNGALDSLRQKSLADQASFMRDLPASPRSDVDMKAAQSKRTSILQEIDRLMKGLGETLNLGGRIPTDLVD